jgi:hypothetical protein
MIIGLGNIMTYIVININLVQFYINHKLSKYNKYYIKNNTMYILYFCKTIIKAFIILCSYKNSVPVRLNNDLNTTLQHYSIEK